MKLEEAIAAIHAPKGITSVIAGVMSGNFDPIREQSGAESSLLGARAKLAAARNAQQNCGSDWAFWGYEGDIAYWEAVVNILEAAEITGADNLPNMPPLDDRPAVVMDMCDRVRQYGIEILRIARNSSGHAPAIQEG